MSAASNMLNERRLANRSIRMLFSSNRTIMYLPVYQLLKRETIHT